MKNSFLIVFFFLFTSIILSQQDTLIYVDGDRIIGKLQIIKSATIEFTDSNSDVTYEIDKSNVRELRLGNGRIIEFQFEELPQEPQQSNVPTDDGIGTCWIVAGTVGIVLVILLIIGAIAQSSN